MIVLATLYGLLYHYFNLNVSGIKPIDASENIINAYKNTSSWILDHFAVFTLFLIPNITIPSYLVFKKQGYNFAEHLVLNTFYIGLLLLINLILFPVLYIYIGIGLLKWSIVTQIIDFVLMYGAILSSSTMYQRLNA